MTSGCVRAGEAQGRAPVLTEASGPPAILRVESDAQSLTEQPVPVQKASSSPPGTNRTRMARRDDTVLTPDAVPPLALATLPAGVAGSSPRPSPVLSMPVTSLVTITSTARRWQGGAPQVSGAGGQLTCNRGTDTAEWTRPGDELAAIPAPQRVPTRRTPQRGCSQRGGGTPYGRPSGDREAGCTPERSGPSLLTLSPVIDAGGSLARPGVQLSRDLQGWGVAAGKQGKASALAAPLLIAEPELLFAKSSLHSPMATSYAPQGRPRDSKWTSEPVPVGPTRAVSRWTKASGTTSGIAKAPAIIHQESTEPSAVKAAVPLSALDMLPQKPA
ncbi:hypothetical protein CB1_000802003 [Camelus ferus]|nr:hypothetical protein CB1_000802003 [Camelus ferus]